MSSLIQIGESVHASIPKPGAAMKQLLQMGSDAYSTPSEPLDFIISLIASQAQNGADYIAVNLDAFGEDDPQLSIDLMRIYVDLVKKHSAGVPVGIDSSDDNVLRAGLEQWFADAPQDIAAPLVNSVKTYTMDKVLPWRNEYKFKFIGLLVNESDAGDNDKNGLYRMAKTIFAGAQKYDFEPGDVFFDSTVFPLAIDMPMSPGQSGYTYNAFEAIKLIKNDPEMAGVHTSLGVSNCVRDLPARKIGVCRAYVQVAQSYGLDAGIVNVNHQYGSKPAADDLVKLVEAFARQDGDRENSDAAMALMGEFCQNSKKPK